MVSSTIKTATLVAASKGAVAGVVSTKVAAVATRQEKTEDGNEERPFDYFTAVRIHDAKTGAEKMSLGELKNASHAYRAFSPDGKTLGVAYGGPSNKLTGGARLFNTQTGELTQTLTGHKHLVVALAFSWDGNTLATGGDYNDQEVRLWDVKTGKVIKALEGLEGSALALAFAPGGKTLACADTAGGVRLWDIETGKEAKALESNAAHASRVAFSRDGRLLLSAGSVEKENKRSGEVRLWDLKTGALLLKLDDTSESAAFSPDDRTLAVLIREKGIRLIGLAELVKD